MSFKTLTESQIVANMIDTYTSLITTVDDMNPGSNVRSVFEAFAQELRRLYQNMQENAAEVQRMSAYTMFNFPLLPAQAAYTIVKLAVSIAPSVDTSVAAGTTVGVRNTNIQYKTPAAMTWTAGSTTLLARVVCTQVGTVGNRRAGDVNTLITPIAGLNGVTVTNTQDIRSGLDLETDDQRANRFQDWINSLHRGDLRSLPYGAKTAKIIDNYGYISEQITKAQLVEGSGSNTIYIDNGYYNTSSALVTQCQQVINGYTDAQGNIIVGYKAAGVPTTIAKATLQAVTITVKISTKPGNTFAMIKTGVETSIKNLVQSLDVGQSLMLNDLNLTIGNTPGVLNFQITAPTADTAPAAGTLLQLATGSPNVTTLP